MPEHTGSTYSKELKEKAVRGYLLHILSRTARKRASKARKKHSQ